MMNNEQLENLQKLRDLFIFITTVTLFIGLFNQFVVKPDKECNNKAIEQGYDYGYKSSHGVCVGEYIRNALK